ncbi:MAG: hypothetical protein A3F68_10325 [Acidobacteria bacterium RIFCSPLOWO2_12_FULL_54_10]|nr:MAG: hypothetical protein A3F68_10325 [Acidobacteria bacterium RIFCSPLOWO2_12_FULL_54_10]
MTVTIQVGVLLVAYDGSLSGLLAISLAKDRAPALVCDLAIRKLILQLELGVAGHGENSSN